jgi:hypothetical protein
MAHLWNPEEIGIAFSIGTAFVLVAQVPAGALVDPIHSKPVAARIAVVAIAAAAVIIALVPALPAVVGALALQAAASCMLTPAIASITLALTHQDGLGERLGYNVRFAAIGAGVTAALMGAVGYWVSPRAVFFLAAGLGLAALAALRLIHPGDITHGSSERCPTPQAHGDPAADPQAVPRPTPADLRGMHGAVPDGQCSGAVARRECGDTHPRALSQSGCDGSHYCAPGAYGDILAMVGAPGRKLGPPAGDAYRLCRTAHSHRATCHDQHPGGPGLLPGAGWDQRFGHRRDTTVGRRRYHTARRSL